MKRLIVIVAALLTLTGASIGTAAASGASVCQPNGTGCTKAGTYPGPNAVISNDYTGFKVIWTKSVVQPYSSGVPLYWTAYMTYTNISSSALTLGCPGSWANASYVSEHMSGGSGDDGTVSAENTTCSQNHSRAVSVAPGSTYTLQATFHNVPWPGSAVSITWGGAGTSPNVNPFLSSASPAPSTSCHNWEFLGLHGINQGSSDSTELSRFKTEVQSHGTDAGGQLPYFESVPYPTIPVSLQDAKAVFRSGPLWQNVLNGVIALQDKVSGITSSCPGSLISLFGYSEGAWIINVWEQLHPGEASNIRNVGLIGDPCYWDVASSGLARLFTSSCSLGADYWFDPPTGTYTECLNLDPVCGGGYLGNAAAMLAGALACWKTPKVCTHYDYPQSGDIGDIASRMLSENGGYLQVLKPDSTGSPVTRWPGFRMFPVRQAKFKGPTNAESLQYSRRVHR